MPTETRFIFFDLQEVCCALLNLRRRCGRPLPEGEIVQPVVEKDEASGSIRFSMRVTGENGALHKVEVGQAELGTALIHFCRQEKIPLPVRANKLVGLVDGSIALICMKEKKDYLPLDDPFSASGALAELGTNTQANSAGADAGSLGTDSVTNGQRTRSERLEKIRLRLRGRAASDVTV